MKTHMHVFHLREVSSYLGIESPERRCGKTTLLRVLGEPRVTARGASKHQNLQRKIFTISCKIGIFKPYAPLGGSHDPR